MKTVRFIIVGISGALVYFLCSYLFLEYTKLPAYLASLLAFACAFCFAYLGQKCWAFRSKISHRITLYRYAILQLCCAAFAAIFTQIFVSHGHLSIIQLSGLATIFTSGISYFVSSYWVFADSTEQDLTAKASGNSLNVSVDPFLFLHRHWQSICVVLIWLLISTVYVFLYDHMPWSLNLLAGHDDFLFVQQAYSLTEGNWLGSYSQFTLMKGPGYSFFMALVHLLNISLYAATAIFHCIAVSIFAWCIYRLTQSKILTAVLFVSVLLIPLIVSNGRIIRDQIYPDQFLLGFSALVYSLFIADSMLKRTSSAVVAGIMLAWFWLTREEGVWVLPTCILLILLGGLKFWGSKQFKQVLTGSVLALFLSFSFVQGAFQLTNWHYYGQLIGLDIKETNFKATLSALQSVREGESISHVPVSRQTMARIYEVSPSFSELKPYFNSRYGQGWLSGACYVYPWSCYKEYAGGWFIWALRDAVAFVGYYKTPKKAAGFYKKVAYEVNQACDDGRLNCSKSLLSYMPKIVEKDIEEVPQTLNKLIDELLLTDFSTLNIQRNSVLAGSNNASKLAGLDFFHSQDRFNFVGKNVTISGKYAVDRKHFQPIDLVISNRNNKVFSHTWVHNSLVPDEDGFFPFSLNTQCYGLCRLAIKIAEEEFSSPIPDDTLLLSDSKFIEMGSWKILFEKVVWEKNLIANISSVDNITYELRQKLLEFFRSILPALLSLGIIALLVQIVVFINSRYFPVLFVVNTALWLAVCARLVILFLVHISSFPALDRLYFMPLYSLVLITSVISIYLLVNFLMRSLNDSKLTML